jgi:hypothetical protein
LRYHHGHLPFHHAHHAIHCSRVCHRIRGCLPSSFGSTFEEGSAFEAVDEEAFAGLKGRRGQDGGGVVAEVYATNDGLTLAGF